MSESTLDARAERARTRRVARRLVRREPVAYAIGWVGWVAFNLFTIPTGLALKAVLDRLAPDAPGADGVWVLLAVLAGLEVGRWLDLWFSAVQWHGCWVGWHTIPRLHALRALAVDPGPAEGRLPGSPGEAVSRFRDDTRDIAMVLDVWLDVSGAVLASAGALVVMATIDARTTLVVAAPVVAVLVACHLLTPRLRAWRRASREATAEVTGFIGDTFGAITAVKAAGAEAAVVERFEALGRRRARTAEHDQVGTQLVRTLGGATGNLGVGLTLLLVAPAISRGEFSVGDLGLFTAYASVLASLPRWVGSLGATMRQADVSVARIGELLPDGGAEAAAAPIATELRTGPDPAPAAVVADPAERRDGDRLERLTVRDLTVRAGDVTVLDGIGLDLPRGSFTVVTGPVGSGKTTLLRAILGLVGRERGELAWNGVVVDDPSTVFVPPRAAYLPQVPRLFSEPLADTVLLGLDRSGLDRALHLACLDDDVAAMAAGVETVVGARGVRLSGGQIQRAGAARALVRRPELLVVDDLSSALDAATEAQLWQRFLAATAGGATALVVTHRPEVIAAADQVIRLGR